MKRSKRSVTSLVLPPTTATPKRPEIELRAVAEKLGVRHDNLLRDLRSHIDNFDDRVVYTGVGKSHSSWLRSEISQRYVEKVYTNDRGREYQTYSLTILGVIDFLSFKSHSENARNLLQHILTEMVTQQYQEQKKLMSLAARRQRGLKNEVPMNQKTLKVLTPIDGKHKKDGTQCYSL